MKKFLVATLIACSLAACAQVASFEQKAAPMVAEACATFRSAEADPLVQLALAGGSTAATAATGVPVGAAVALVQSYGDAFCSAGPPPGDATTAAQRVAWLADVATKMLAAAQGQ